MSASTRPATRASRVALAAAIALVCSSCLYFPAYRQLQKATPGALPWWCEGTTPADDLAPGDCDAFSLQLDVMYGWAAQHPTQADAVAAGATLLGALDGFGAAYLVPGRPTSFDPSAPQVLLYRGQDGADPLVGVAHRVLAAEEPAGYPGERDAWVAPTEGEWVLPVRFVRGWEEQRDVFAFTHPCLQSAVTYTATTDPCFVESHPEPFQLLVTNDDGIGAPGIDAVVEELRQLPNTELTVSAPATNQSGSGDRQTAGGAPGSPGQTASGYAGTAVAGTPADSVIYAYNVLEATPDLVVSGTNYGANMGPVIPLSGTVGAARTAARLGIPAVAVSTGIGPSVATTDFASSAEAVARWVEEFRLGLVGPPGTEVANINTPTCTSGAIRGTVDTAVATALDGRGYNTQDCTSSVTTLVDDIDAMNHGFISRTDAGLS